MEVIRHRQKVLSSRNLDQRCYCRLLIHLFAGFRTDADISQNGKSARERELQAWSDGNTASGGAPTSNGAPASRGDELTFGSTGSNSWDQFSVNQQLFGVTTDYNEELYTTKLDRSRPDFKERERQAAQIANEIQSVRIEQFLLLRRSTDRVPSNPRPTLTLRKSEVQPTIAG